MMTNVWQEYGHELPPKPRKGNKCNGCGVCCIAEPCLIAQELLNCMVGPCIALEREDGRTYCGMVRRPMHYMAAKDVPQSITGELQVHVAGMLGIGMGCDSDDD